jgi:hypothetical protein
MQVTLPSQQVMRRTHYRSDGGPSCGETLGQSGVRSPVNGLFEPRQYWAGQRSGYRRTQGAARCVRRTCPLAHKSAAGAHEKPNPTITTSDRLRRPQPAVTHKLLASLAANYEDFRNLREGVISSRFLPGAMSVLVAPKLSDAC